MDYDELYQLYKALQLEKENLVQENTHLRQLLGMESRASETNESNSDNSPAECDSPESESTYVVEHVFGNSEKVELFMSLFRGREDVYPKRWQNQKEASGYSPVCMNEWRDGICMKPRIKCSNCSAQSYAALDENVIESHLKGKNVIGVYPLLKDDTSWFLALDFDGKQWEENVAVVRSVCEEFNIPVAVERSRSGNGAHVWFFFEMPISASVARRFGAALLTCAMNRRHELSFDSYDRMFPNQDTLPKGGFGNLIALPLQKHARASGNSVFVDASSNQYEDQWGFLASVRRLLADDLRRLTGILSPGGELGALKRDEESDERPWDSIVHPLRFDELPSVIEIIRGNMLYIPKQGLSDRALNQLKRLAAFRNPEFYKAQAMRMSIFGKPRIISCSEEDDHYLYLPRGCEQPLVDLFDTIGVQTDWIDRTNGGRSIDVQFNGGLRDDQPKALTQLMNGTNGVLSGTTAFGKTVVALNLIAERKVSTLIIVDKVSLISQWKERINQFLIINEALPVTEPIKKRGRKKALSVVGQIGAGKNQVSGIIDIAVMQSLNRQGEVKDLVMNYGMVIVDECHHISAFSFEEVLKRVNARYVYGLTATPTRKDGHHPIIFMQCGPIRFRDDAIMQAMKRPFDHFVIPRFTSFRLPTWQSEGDATIQDVYSELVKSESRDEQIVEDVIACYQDGRNCIVLTGRTAHVEHLTDRIRKMVPDVIALTGGMGTKATREAIRQLRETPSAQPVVVVATGKFVGEGFDEPRLDTLFLAMPISWKGTLQQYAGRLHRLYEGKREVRIYDYIDLHVKVLERMYNRRMTGYASIGYRAKGEQIDDVSEVIFDQGTFLPVFTHDVLSSRREAYIVSPFITKKRTLAMLETLKKTIKIGVRTVVVTRPIDSYPSERTNEMMDTFNELIESGVEIVYRKNIHQKFAILDQKIVWYGSINLLSYGNSEESMMRLSNRNIAFELMKAIEPA